MANSVEPMNLVAQIHESGKVMCLIIELIKLIMAPSGGSFLRLRIVTGEKKNIMHHIRH